MTSKNETGVTPPSPAVVPHNKRPTILVYPTGESPVQFPKHTGYHLEKKKAVGKFSCLHELECSDCGPPCDLIVEYDVSEHPISVLRLKAY
jgi:hypothetical protein